MPNNFVQASRCFLSSTLWVTARRINPDLVIIARLGYLAKGMAATELGASEVVIEEIATAQAMEKAALARLADALASRNANKDANDE